MKSVPGTAPQLSPPNANLKSVPGTAPHVLGDGAGIVPPMANDPELPNPPRAPERPHVREIHETTVDDPWFWLRDREDEATIEYLNAENAYATALMADWGGLPNQLFEEIRTRIQETDMSVPVRKGAYWYHGRTEKGQQYAIHGRRHDNNGEPGHEEELLLDENELAGDSPYLGVGDLAVSPDHSLMIYTVDFEGNEKYELRIRDLAADTHLDDVVTDIGYGTVWANDNTTIFYTLTDETQRPFRVMRHVLGTSVSTDVLVFEESDERFWVSLGRTRSERFVVIASESTSTTEVHLLSADDPTSDLMLVEPRREGHEYRVEHHGDRLLIVTNHEALDFKLVETPLDNPGFGNWVDLIPAEDGVRLVDVEAFARHLVITRRRNNVPRVAIRDLESNAEHNIEFEDEVFEVGGASNVEFNSSTFRFGYTSMVTPGSLYDYDMNTRERNLLKRQAVLGEFNETNYRTARDWATGPDGTRVPVSLVWHRDTPLDGTAPGVLYGYGAYEMIMPASFSSSRLSLLDRGFVYAVAHVRGGGELGRTWYDGARFEHKMNTFTDFVAVAEHLGENNWIDPTKLVIRGGSAGGLLMGAALNLAPNLFAGVIAEVPFVDNINTMLDATLPLTVNEYEEWGNPEDPAIYAAMRAYSPYENVAEVSHPPLYVTAGLNDPRVQYWEPAKWVARLRKLSTSAAPILLKTEMGAGHGGPSGRYDAWHDEADVLAFTIRCTAA